MKRRIWTVLVGWTLAMLVANGVAAADGGGTLPTKVPDPVPAPASAPAP